MSDPRPVRWGFLGAGRIASRATAPAVHASGAAVLHAVAARDVARAAALGPVRAYDHYAAVLEDDDVEAVYINLTNEAHRPWVEAALRAGKHVLCEKPLGLDASEVAAMFDVAEQSERLLTEALWTRWHPRTQAVERHILNGDIGHVLHVAAAFSISGVSAGDFRMDPSRGGGALLDLGCYCLSAVAAALQDAIPGSVESEVLFADTGVDLTSDLRLEFATGAEGTVHCSMTEPGSQSITVVGSEGRITVPKPAFSAGPDEIARLTLTTGDSPMEETFAPVDAFERMVSQVSLNIRGDAGFTVAREHSLAVATMSDMARARWQLPGS